MIRSSRFPKIKDVIPLTNGVFGHMNYTFPETISVTKEQLDYLFMSSFARRNPAPVIDLLHDSEEGETDFSQLTDAELTKLAALMLAYYKPKWDRLGEIYSIEYDPIHNFLDEWEDEADGTLDRDTTVDRDETDTFNTTVNHTNTRTDNLSETEQRDLGNSNEREFINTKEKTEYHSKSTHTIDANNPMKEEVEYGKKDLREDDLVRKNTGSETTTTDNTDTSAIWGFNSGSAVNSDRTTTDGSNTHTIDDSNPLKETNTGFQSHTLSGKDTTKNTGAYDDEKSGYDELSKSGKIKDVGTDTGYLSTNNTGTQTNNGYDATTGTNSRAVDETDSTDEATHRERSGRHFGNIGNLTSQKMIQEEIELWKWNYIQSILEDARDFLTLPMYL